MTGKVLSLEWLGHIKKRCVAQGGTAEQAEAIYDAFHALHAKAKLAQRRLVSRRAPIPLADKEEMKWVGAAGESTASDKSNDV